jgi:hypothetical protein
MHGRCESCSPGSTSLHYQTRAESLAACRVFCTSVPYRPAAAPATDRTGTGTGTGTGTVLVLVLVLTGTPVRFRSGTGLPVPVPSSSTTSTSAGTVPVPTAAGRSVGAEAGAAVSGSVQYGRCSVVGGRVLASSARVAARCRRSVDAARRGARPPAVRRWRAWRVTVICVPPARAAVGETRVAWASRGAGRPWPALARRARVSGRGAERNDNSTYGWIG